MSVVPSRRFHSTSRLISGCPRRACSIADSRPTWLTQSGVIPFDLVIGSGSALTNLGNFGYSALLLLDAVQPGGITELKSDPFGLIPALGAVALQNPQAVVQ